MSRAEWEPTAPDTMQEAIRLCLDYALHAHNRSIKQVAALNGISEWVIYKWMSDGSIPSKRIRPFEFACDATFVTEYLSHTADLVLVPIPPAETLAAVTQDDLLDLQAHMADTVQQLRQFYRGGENRAPVMTSIMAALTALASHRAKINAADTLETSQ